MNRGPRPRESRWRERLLKGWTQEGIAADLGLTAATVKTCRDCVFRRLDIRLRHELLALVAAGPAAANTESR